MARHLPKFLRASEPEALLNAASCERDRLMLRLGLYMGLRVSEICKLKIEDIDLDEGTALIAQAKGDKDRYVPIPRKVMEPLTQWIGERRSGFVFPSRGGRYSTRTVQRMVKGLAAEVGINRRVTPHALRHTFATQLLQKGADIREVQELLGHSNIQTTSVYLGVSVDRLRGAVERL